MHLPIEASCTVASEAKRLPWQAARPRASVFCCCRTCMKQTDKLQTTNHEDKVSSRARCTCILKRSNNNYLFLATVFPCSFLSDDWMDGSSLMLQLCWVHINHQSLFWCQKWQKKLAGSSTPKLHNFGGGWASASGATCTSLAMLCSSTKRWFCRWKVSLVTF